MARRVSPSRLAGIAAWTAATVTWGTAAVAVANAGTDTSIPTVEALPRAVTIPMQTSVESSVPTMPESGLVVVRYTPTPPPEPKVIVNTVTVQQSPATPQPAPSPAPAPAPTRVRSSGS